MTAIHTVAPAQRTGGRHAAPVSSAVEVSDVHDLLHAAESLTAEAAAARTSRTCEGSDTCERPGALTMVAEERTTSLCGLHAMNVVFSTKGAPVVLVKPAD